MTLRQHLDGILSELTPAVPQTGQPGSWVYHAPNARAIEHAVAALKALDEAPLFYLPDHAKPGVTTSFTAFGLDPREVHAHAKYYAVRALPDPAPPTENTQPRSDPAATTTTKGTT